MPRPKLRTPELRERVLAAAVDLLAAEGVAGFTARRVAAAGDTSVPAVYELFGDKAGLIREVFFAGFRHLGDHLDAVPTSDDPVADLRATIAALRAYRHEHPEVAELMFGRPFADFDPGVEDTAAGERTRRHVVERIQRCIDQGALQGDAVDIAHALMALVRGLGAHEASGWMGSTPAAVERRWDVAVDALLAGLAR